MQEKWTAAELGKLLYERADIPTCHGCQAEMACFGHSAEPICTQFVILLDALNEGSENDAK